LGRGVPKRDKIGRCLLKVRKLAVLTANRKGRLVPVAGV